MSQKSWVRITLCFLAVTFGSVASAQPPFLAPTGDALNAFSRDVRRLSDLTISLERRYQNAVNPLLKYVQANPQPWYQNQFALLLQQTTPIDADKTRIDWVFSKWPQYFAAVAGSLASTYNAQGAASPDLAPIFYNAQDSYARSLAATYLLIEGLKLQYLRTPVGPAFLTGNQRAYLAGQIARLHDAAQNVAAWMYAFRCSNDYAFLFTLQYFPANEAFEVRYRNNYFIGSTPDVVLEHVYDISYFMIPVATADEWKAKLASANVRILPLPALTVVTPNASPAVNPAPAPAPVNPAPVNPNPAPVNPAPANPNPVNPAPANPNPNPNPAPVNPTPNNPAPAPAPIDQAEWQKQWDDVQSQLAQHPDSSDLRQRLWNLEQQKKNLPAQQPAPQQPVPAPTTTPNPPPANTPNPPPQPPAANQNPAPAPQPPSTNAAEIERVQKLLQNPDVQKNETLKHELEELLKSLQSAQPSANNPSAPAQTWANGLGAASHN